MSAPGELAPGTMFGKYQLVRHLATGGMAELFLALVRGIEGFEKEIVVKRMLPHLAKNAELVRMFVDEARLVASLNHPNIAQVLDIGVENGAYFFTMEYIHGPDLRAVLRSAAERKANLPIEHCITILLGATAGLHHAHEHRSPDGTPLGIVHRDISPSNVILSPSGVVKVVDFGIAKAAFGRAETRTGTIKGKISYMSPEQCRGHKVDRRSDIFGLGILLYELTTTRRLFAGKTDFDIMSKIVGDEITPPSLCRSDYPPALEQVVLRALAQNPDERFATAEEMQVELEAFARSEGLQSSPTALARFLNDPALEGIHSKLPRRSTSGSMSWPSSSGAVSLPNIGGGTFPGVSGVRVVTATTGASLLAKTSVRADTDAQRALKARDAIETSGEISVDLGEDQDWGDHDESANLQVNYDSTGPSYSGSFPPLDEGEPWPDVPYDGPTYLDMARPDHIRGLELTIGLALAALGLMLMVAGPLLVGKSKEYRFDGGTQAQPTAPKR